MRPKTRILIVDDDARLRKTLSDILGAKGYAPDAVATGRAALAWIEEETPAVALIDLRLEDMPGPGVMGAIKERSPTTECIVITGYASQASAVEAINLGAYSYVQKPYDMDQLLLTIQRAVEKREAAETLRESEQRFQDVVRTSGDWLWEVDAKGRYTYASPVVEQVLGYTAEEVLGKHYYDFCHPDDWEELQTLAQETLQRKEPFVRLVNRDIHKDGRSVILETTGLPLTDGGGNLLGYRGVDRDITERVRAEEELRRRAERLAAVNRVARAASVSLQMDALLETVYREFVSLFRPDALFIALYDRENQELDYRLRVDEGVRASPDRQPLGSGLTSVVVAEKKPLLVRDFEKEKDRLPEARRWGTMKVPASWLGVPMQIGEQVVGVISVQAYRPQAYGEEEQQLLSTLADQVAVALENARLYEETRQRAEEMAALYQTALDLTTQLEMPRLLDAILERAVALLGATGGLVHLYDPAAERLVAVTSHRLEKDYTGLSLRVGEGAAGQAFETGEPLIVDDHRTWAGKSPQVADSDARSLVCVPLRWQEQIIGVLDVMDNERAGAFGKKDLRLLEPFAAQAAIAIQNARLYEETRRRNRELALLNRVIAASAAGQDVETVLETVCRELALAFDVPQSAAALFNEEKTEAVVVAEYPSPGSGQRRAEGRPPSLGEIIPVEGNLASQYLLAHKTPLVIENAQTDPRQSPIHDLMRRRGTVSQLLLPLLVEDEVVGSLGLDAIEPRPFSTEEVDLAQRVAEQVSAVLARARLEETRQRLSAAVEQAAETVIITDTEDAILYVNPAFERISGYSRAEVLGQTPRILGSGQHDDAFYRELWGTISAGRVWQGRFVNRRKDGSLYTEEATITPVRNQAGEIVNYVTVKRDVTREVELEEQFRQAQKMEAIGQLAAGVAHDFNNLLTVIHLSSRLLEKQLHPQDPLWEHVRRIQDAGQRATRLIRQLLSFSRKEIIEPRLLDLNQVIGDLSKMLRRMIREDVELLISPADDLWPVSMDATQADQVIVNLAVNARDAMPQGGNLTIETANVVLDEAYTAFHIDAQPGEYVLLTVSDTGMGMDDAVKAHLFEPFFTTKERGEGTGLGLATVYGIVKQSGGHIGVYSEVGRGTTFKIYLPRAEEAAAELLSRAALSAPVRGTETVLVVEDADGIRDLTVGVLKAHGYQVLVARNGVEALELSERHEGPIHLLLSDVVMPRMSGQELAEQLQSQRPETRVLYASGYADEAIAHRGSFLRKPFTLEGLTRKVRAVLDGQA